MGRIVLSARGLTRVHGTGAARRAVLDGVDLEVAEGELVAVVGPSGSGKSTLLNLLGGLDRPTAGSVEIAGRDLAGLRDRELALLRRRSIGVVFQFFNLVPELTVRENVLLPARLAGDVAAGRARAAALLDRLGVAAVADQLPAELSGGEQQRVAIARALVNEPTLVLADEPTGNLDEAAGEAVMAILRGIVEEGRAIVMVTHHAEHARAADRVLRMRDGRIEP